GIRSQKIQPPKGSFRGKPSAKTRARLAPLAPNPRRERPCEVGLAVRLPERRKRLKAGTWRSMSSTVRAAVLESDAGERTTTDVGVSSKRVGARFATTVICCVMPAGWRAIWIELVFPSQVTCRDSKPGAEMTRVPEVAGSSVNRNSPLLSVVADRRKSPFSKV